MDTTDPQAIQLAKKRLRQQMREKLRDMSDEQRQHHRKAVSRNIPDDHLRAKGAPIMGFLTTDDEPNVDTLLKLSGMPICFPSIDWDAKTMEAMQVDPAKFETRIQRHGIREAVGGKLVEPNDLGVIIVPGLAFDRTGARLGRGGGFYDIFLSRINRRVENNLPRPFVIGACFAFQLVDKVPTVPQDQRMDAIVTEQDFTICEA